MLFRSFVAFGRTENACNFPYLDEDSELGMRLIAHHLADLGHQRIAIISAPEELMFSHFRLKGFKDGLKEKGIHLDESMMVIGDLTQRDGFTKANILLDRPNPPTAIAACNDLMALGAIAAAQKRGLQVGKAIAITGFDNIPLAENSHPSLTTIHQPIYQIGNQVCEMLIRRIKGESIESENALLEPKLVIRESSGSSIEF